MKFSTLLKLTFITNIIATSLIAIPSAKANTFDEKEIAQERVIAIASPYRHGYNLVVIEQVPGKDKCWAEHGISPVTVDPLLMNFDFTGHCRRATDSNGYSVRIGGEERGSDYLLKIVEEGNELVLIGTTRNGEAPITIGRTQGTTGGANKIFLNPGWRFTKRSYQGQELGHFYFSQGASTTAQTPQALAE
ncbi:MAG: DUF3747 domain-containing protein [Pleurocapsa sp. MO_226.B13]|nr:DUF3747 domain-containing protein [Pleurocapsa sp. MO_226.B13]